MDDSPANAAFIFVAANYDTSQGSLVGRQVASEEFLREFARHSGIERMFCYTQTQPDFEEFTRPIESYAGAPRPTTWIRPTELSAVEPISTLFRLGPDICHYAWLRRQFDQRGFSLCGITHTTADNFAMDALGGLMTALLQQWDALVCTLQAVKDMVARLFDRWGGDLEERFGAPVRRQFELPVVPLGVDCDRLTDDALAQAARQKTPARHGIAGDVTGYQGYALATSQSIAVDVAALAAAFTRLAGDTDLRRRMGEAGRKRAREGFDRRVVIASIRRRGRSLRSAAAGRARSCNASPDVPPVRCVTIPTRCSKPIPASVSCRRAG